MIVAFLIHPLKKMSQQFLLRKERKISSKFQIFLILKFGASWQHVRQPAWLSFWHLTHSRFHGADLRHEFKQHVSGKCNKNNHWYDSENTHTNIKIMWLKQLILKLISKVLNVFLPGGLLANTWPVRQRNSSSSIIAILEHESRRSFLQSHDWGTELLPRLLLTTSGFLPLRKWKTKWTCHIIHPLRKQTQDGWGLLQQSYTLNCVLFR